MRTIKHVKSVGPHRLHVIFDDGASGVWRVDPVDHAINMAKPLSDSSLFARALVIPDFGGLDWPNGFDASPDWIYMQIEQAGLLDPHQAAK